MNKFEDLPANVRALLLAKLAMELKANGCVNLCDLAMRKNIDMTTAWRGVCLAAKQPRCTIPQDVMPRR
jgi:hypothetical protein